jgi:hypothetical protein
MRMDILELLTSTSFCELDDGIETGLVEWWLADTDLFLSYEEFKEW